MKKNFNATSSTYRFRLADEAARAYAEYPALKDHLVFVDTSTGSVIAGTAAAKDQAKYLLNTNRTLYQAQRDYDSAKSSGCYSSGGMTFVLFYAGRDLSFLPGQNIDQQQLFIFNHELAHQLCPLARKKGHVSECVADSYAALRHRQSFGNDQGLLTALIAKRAEGVRRGADSETFDYFTSVALQAAVQADVAPLTADDAVTLAGKIGEANAVTPDKAAKIAAQIRGQNPSRTAGPRR